jgi:hypothetical protein
MHEELDRLRRELKQRIFVGEPIGETFLAVAPERILEAKREQIAAKSAEETLAQRRPRAAKKGPMTLDDF